MVKTSREQSGIVALLKDPERLPSKTRLAAGLGAPAARAFYEASLRAVSAQLRRLSSEGFVTFVAHAPDEVSLNFASLFRAAQLVPQGEGGLGSRIETADRALREDGVEVALFIGGDSPDLADERLVALAHLGGHDAALITSDDGGFVALASRKPLPPLDGVRWSDPETSADLLSTLKTAGFSVGIEGSWFDVDELPDLMALRERLRLQDRSELRDLLKVCEAVLGPD